MLIPLCQACTAPSISHNKRRWNQHHTLHGRDLWDKLLERLLSRRVQQRLARLTGDIESVRRDEAAVDRCGGRAAVVSVGRQGVRHGGTANDCEACWLHCESKVINVDVMKGFQLICDIGWSSWAYTVVPIGDMIFILGTGPRKLWRQANLYNRFSVIFCPI